MTQTDVFSAAALGFIKLSFSPRNRRKESGTGKCQPFGESAHDGQNVLPLLEESGSVGNYRKDDPHRSQAYTSEAQAEASFSDSRQDFGRPDIHTARRMPPLPEGTRRASG